MKSKIEIFTSLGERLRKFVASADSHNIISYAIEANPWFTERDIISAVEAICTQMLDKERLERWLANYPTATTPQRVAIIMAGNIPLVGFSTCCVCYAQAMRHI